MAIPPIAAYTPSSTKCCPDPTRLERLPFRIVNIILLADNLFNTQLRSDNRNHLLLNIKNFFLTRKLIDQILCDSYSFSLKENSTWLMVDLVRFWKLTVSHEINPIQCCIWVKFNVLFFWSVMSWFDIFMEHLEINTNHSETYFY